MTLPNSGLQRLRKIPATTQAHPYSPPDLSEEHFRRERTSLVLGTMALSTLAIFLIETLVMLVLEHFLALPPLTVLALDGLVLVVCLIPLNYIFIVRPMAAHLEGHHRANLELFKSYEILERFFSIKELMIALMDREFNYIRVNPAYAQADEKAPEEFVGKNLFELYDNEENRALFESVVQTGQPVSVLERAYVSIPHPERGTTYWDWNLLPVRDQNDQVMGVILTASDVTARKLAQIAKEEYERRFGAIFNQTFQHIGLLDPGGKILTFNQTSLDFSGLKLQEIEGQPFWSLPCWDVNLPEANLRAMVMEAAAGKVVERELRVITSAGQVAIVDGTLKPFRDENGEARMLIFEGRDITQRIETEQALLRSESEITRLYEAEMRAREFSETLRNAGMQLSSSLNSTTILETYIDHLQQVAPFRSAHILLLNDEDQLVVRLAREDEDYLPPTPMLGQQFSIAEMPLVQTMLREGQIQSLADISIYPHYALSPYHPAIHSWVGIPLVAGDKAIGLCTLEHEAVGFFTQEQIDWATALTGQAVVAIQNAWLFEQVQDNRERLQALSRRLVEVQELERHHIARELHDEAGQALASLMVGLRLLERDGVDRETVGARCQELKQIADGVMENLHRLAIDLRPASLDHLGLVAALRQQSKLISDQHEITVRFETVGKIDRLPEEIETAIYRIVQEALTNVVRHARANRVDVLLERRSQSLLVVVEDNGIGFDPSRQAAHNLGLVGMHERAEMLGGTLSIESTAGVGTTILLEVACPSD